jgi:hypothetical protein
VMVESEWWIVFGQRRRDKAGVFALRGSARFVSAAKLREAPQRRNSRIGYILVLELGMDEVFRRGKHVFVLRWRCSSG